VSSTATAIAGANATIRTCARIAGWLIAQAPSAAGAGERSAVLELDREGARHVRVDADLEFQRILQRRQFAPGERGAQRTSRLAADLRRGGVQSEQRSSPHVRRRERDQGDAAQEGGTQDVLDRAAVEDGTVGNRQQHVRFRKDLAQFPCEILGSSHPAKAHAQALRRRARREPVAQGGGLGPEQHGDPASFRQRQADQRHLPWLRLIEQHGGKRLAARPAGLGNALEGNLGQEHAQIERRRDVALREAAAGAGADRHRGAQRPLRRAIWLVGDPLRYVGSRAQLAAHGLRDFGIRAAALAEEDQHRVGSRRRVRRQRGQHQPSSDSQHRRHAVGRARKVGTC
jgi:hypothetical protein